MSYNFEEEKVINEIVKRDAKKVLLQFPEGLKYFSIEIVNKLRQKLPNVEFIISGEPSWGACDIAEDEAKEIGADLIIHFGHTPYTWYYPKFPTVFINVESKINLNPKILDDLIQILKNKYDAKKVSLTSTLQHVKLLPEIKKGLEDHFEVIIGKPSSKFMFDGQVLGCDYKPAEVPADVYIIVSGGLFHAIGLGLTTNKPTIKVDPYTQKVEDLTNEIQKILKIRYAKIMEAFDKRNWVIIQGIKVGQNRPLMVKYFYDELNKRGYNVYIVTNKVLTIDVLRNIDRSFVDVFLVTSCPRLPIDDLFNYEKPVLTPGEAKMVINNSLEPYIFPW
ncbi:diphthamide biosynthesis enzyme Dph2 [Sulfolobus sp. A20]|uniref:diphthamide biosynthesis enzyme Dph2 n=1 Tax=Saccharolobus sp. A20 TaxID=1891280 RepID=UPI000846259B|nr:diphthamide biosynthesis enzyme Dph2 [Sulfolobus sp. A20]TRM75517.1 diphthamide biosynthesis enzyme Dph2 [Sulfolobus sp. A20-N-F8]TRM79302.1 diphthamide biosynthesis enzyme Dph2 [Sulfolobus sp. B5]TRM82160.1 diphthamide biosynthesis enzyme Dph2 [Sulfolobus sp. D5]TRM88529.1 diphthamide biosynthesis enzyme Dph2 [Sulfolobus sp. E3]AOL16082.1 diphthamide biosynthesis enzyme Dph2 [Sulfolobus sp. A20]